jgi:nicotinamidase/pyrazinamidase
MLSSHDALVIVDPQVDFFPGGALAVPDGDAILPAVNRALETFAERGLLVVVTRDWHPTDHCSFASQDGPWPPHCVRGTSGAELHPNLALPPMFTMIHKASEPDCVRATCLDGVDAGFQVVLLTDATRAVNLHTDDGDRALAELVAVGVRPLEGVPE